MKVIVQDGGTIIDAAGVHDPGQMVELEDAEAERLIRVGKVRPIELELVEPLQIDVQVEAVVDAIGTMPIDDHALWTKSGAPKTEALAQILEREVSAEVRDTAWAAYRESRA